MEIYSATLCSLPSRYFIPKYCIAGEVKILKVQKKRRTLNPNFKIVFIQQSSQKSATTFIVTMHAVTMVITNTMWEV